VLVLAHLGKVNRVSSLATMTRIAAVMARTKNDKSRIAKAGVETGAKMLGVSIAWCMLLRESKVHANGKGLVLLRAEWSPANF
jgi:hypothetical protein